MKYLMIHGDSEFDDVEIVKFPIEDGKFVVLCMLKEKDNKNNMTEEEIFKYLIKKRLL